MINLGQCCLVVLPKLLAVRNKSAVKFQRPVFAKSPKGNSRVVLDNAAAVTQQKIANARKTFTVHQIGSRLDQADPGPASGAPAKKTTIAAG